MDNVQNKYLEGCFQGGHGSHSAVAPEKKNNNNL
jgi:hypothetical protein